jgi:malate dehydrogenase (quinone)
VPKLKEMVPSLGVELSGEPTLFEEVWARGTKVLKLDKPASGVPAATGDESAAGTGHSPTAATA